MSTTNTTVSGTVTNNESTTTSYSTSSLAQIFANFMLGSSSRDMTTQKYIQLYKLRVEDLILRYEQNHALPTDNALLDNPSPVRTAHLSTVTNDVSADEYYSTFISTIDGSEVTLQPVSNSDSLSIGLQIGSTLLAAATFDNTVYSKLRDGSRSEIRWKLGVNSTSTSQGDE